jgi:hypothetical protein
MNRLLFSIGLLLAFAFSAQATIVTGTVTNAAGAAVSCKVNFVKLGTEAGDGMIMTRQDMFQRETVTATGAFSIELTPGTYLMSLFDGTIYRQRILTVTGTTADYHALTSWYDETVPQNGASITNIPTTGLTSAILRSLATNNASTLTNIPATGLSSAVLIKLATNNAASLTNITASSTNADTATIATWVTGNGAALTNQVGSQGYLTVNGASDGIEVAFRAFAAQTNPVFAVQSSGAANLVSVGPQGALFLATNAVADWPTNADTYGGAAFVNSNATVFLLISGPNSRAWTSTNKIAP